MQVAVFNDNIYPYKEKFRDKILEIPAKGHIMMDHDEAKIFLGTFNAPMLDADGNHMPQGYKMLRILGKKLPNLEPVKKLICHQCNMVFDSQADLETHIVALHVDNLMQETDAEKKVVEEIKAKSKSLTPEQVKLEQEKLETHKKSSEKSAGAFGL